jgi:putative ABC transport system permease protein
MPANDFFKNPAVNIQVVIAAIIILIFAGIIASYLPARKAAMIKPIEALNDE